MNTDKIIFKKPITGYEGSYEIHSNGRVWSLYFNKYLIAQSHKEGYPLVGLSKNSIQKSFTVHRIVAIAFIPNPENKPMVNHKNGIKSDNRVENLEWCTSSENINHAFRSGLKKIEKGENNPMFGRRGSKANRSIPVNKIDIKTGEVVFTYESGRQAAAAHNVGYNAICHCCSGITNSSCGFKWQYSPKK